MVKHLHYKYNYIYILAPTKELDCCSDFRQKLTSLLTAVVIVLFCVGVSYSMEITLPIFLFFLVYAVLAYRY